MPDDARSSRRRDGSSSGSRDERSGTGRRTGGGGSGRSGTGGSSGTGGRGRTTRSGSSGSTSGQSSSSRSARSGGGGAQRRGSGSGKPAATERREGARDGERRAPRTGHGRFTERREGSRDDERRTPHRGDGRSTERRETGGARPERRGAGTGDRRTADTRDTARRDSDRGRPERSAGERPPARKPWSAEGELPRWIQDEIARVTAKQRVAPVTEFLQSAAKNFAAAKYGKALFDAEQAKELAPRVATVREILGLAAYRLGRWDVALRELRTFRRLTGETTHMPVEMDVLRALDRPADVEETWTAFRRLGGDRATEHEARVVFGSFLLDSGDDRRAWSVTDPKRLSASPEESELRVWFVAARAAARIGDLATGRRLYEAIQTADPGFPGLDELDRATSGR